MKPFLCPSAAAADDAFVYNRNTYSTGVEDDVEEEGRVPLVSVFTLDKELALPSKAKGENGAAYCLWLNSRCF